RPRARSETAHRTSSAGLRHRLAATRLSCIRPRSSVSGTSHPPDDSLLGRRAGQAEPSVTRRTRRAVGPVRRTATLQRRRSAPISSRDPRILAMLRASFPVLRAAVVVGGLLALQGAVAGDRDGDRRVTNSFVLVTAAPPAKPVVSNPYQVPLLQNAGTLRAR